MLELSNFINSIYIKITVFLVIVWRLGDWNTQQVFYGFAFGIAVVALKEIIHYITEEGGLHGRRTKEE